MFRSLIPRKERSLMPSDRFSRMMEQMESQFEELSKRFWGGDGGWLTPEFDFVPTTDLVETENQFELTVDLPGMKPEEVHVEFKDGALWVSGNREEKKEEKGETHHWMERRYGEFRRVLPMPAAVDENAIEAKFEDGVLKITVPKTEEAKTKHIEVKA